MITSILELVLGVGGFVLLTCGILLWSWIVMSN